MDALEGCESGKIQKIEKHFTWFLRAAHHMTFNKFSSWYESCRQKL